MIDFMATRTAFFDEFFLGAADAGVRQVVILAAGLDARTWRLPWPDGTVVYELDQPKVLEFKSDTLRDHGAEPKAQLVNVPIDLRQDWPKALQQAGFDPSRPAAWSAEGLVRYLPAQAQDLLFERVHALSAVGSWLASNVPAEGFTAPERVQRQREEMRRMRAAAAKLVDVEITDFDDLWYAEERTPVDAWLREHGWDVSVATFEELMSRYGRDVPPGAEDAMPPTLYVSAHRRHG
jgi:methyltransferase (TIGR00027 family)